MLIDKIIQKKSGIITYGITPPRQTCSHEKIVEITGNHIERLKIMKIDGLVIYDVQDEKARTSAERPFPFLPTLDPDFYYRNYLNKLTLPKVIYKAVSNHTKDSLTGFINENSSQDVLAVFVGAASSRQKTVTKLEDAYKINAQHDAGLTLGGVTIPERHLSSHNEHLRVIKKMENGCKFFISQAVYNLEASKNFLSDYYFYCNENGIDMVPILFTLTPCGSLKTLEFMKWLGINIPRWLENELQNSEDILDKSVDILKRQFAELLDFAIEKKIPIGCNIESVSIRKVEIERSVQLVEEIREIFGLT
ncbi:MAG: methylenetetrahydrofolate reductase [Spirochaetes bacterium]|nr:methylenetetrahydrofolate reductase [Spirochaetota bacterium]MBN2771157.1 methylenetetrahydrofolate reductase [Spirochaetota bacterium]